MHNKTCIKCNETKDLSLFSKLSKSKDGRSSYCKKCHNKISNKYKEVEFTCPVCKETRKTRFENLTKLTEEQRLLRIYPCKKCCQIGNRFLPCDEALKNRIYNQIRTGAKTRKLEFNLSKENVISQVFNNCFYCGKEPSNIIKSSRGRGLMYYNGLDRIDNSKGYNIDNVVPCCSRCNKAKQKMSSEEFSQLISDIYHKFVNP